MNKGMLVVISGPSGCGKDTVISHYKKINKGIRLSVSMTTRAKRQNEQEGVDYYYVSEDEFKQLVNDGGLVEYAHYAGNWYGTPKAQLDAWLEEGKTVVLIIEVQGGAKIKATYPDAVSIFLLPPSMSVLECRLRGRETDDEEEIAKRMETAITEINCAYNYDFLVINDSVEAAVAQINNIIDSEKLRTDRSIKLIEGVLNNA